MSIDCSASRRAAVTAVFIVGLIGTTGAQSPRPDAAAAPLFAHLRQYPLLPRTLETELALNAAPPHLRDSATVLVLEDTGYITAVHGSSGFTCMVSHRGGDLFPVCWDPEGVRSLLPIDLDDARLRLEGKSAADVDRAVAAGFGSGRYHPPSRAGLAYMLSPIRYRIDDHGQVTRTNPNPHVMFYGPNLTDADIGGLRGSVAYMNKVGPDGMIIVPVGQREREIIVTQSLALTERVERAIGFTPPR